MKPLRIMLTDLCYLNKLNLDFAYVPLNIGYVGAYAKARFGSSVDLSLNKEPLEFLEAALACRPHLIGFSLYCWNTDLTRTLISIVRKRLGDDVVIAVGGPSVDIDPKVQLSIFDQLPGVDALIPDDGEVGFSNLLSLLLEQGHGYPCQSVDGVVFRDGSSLVVGQSVGPALDLSTLPSPYLTGLLDKFLTPPFMPIIETTRGCPHTCKFCAAGRNRHKLRQFPLDQVKEEISFLSQKYRGEKNLPLFVADLNFGIFKRDIEIARFIRETSLASEYPTCVDMYTDKGFSPRTRAVMEELNGLQSSGLIIALQSENEKTLKSIKRRNLGEKEIAETILWARARGIESGAQIIFGLPDETKKSFVDMLKRAWDRKFDDIYVANLLLFNGSVLNRAAERRGNGTVTRFRSLSSSYMDIDGCFAAETLEVVVASDSFSFDDYLALRRLSFMLFAISGPGFYKMFFRGLDGLGVDCFNFLDNFLSPTADHQWPQEYLNFLADLDRTFRSELYKDADILKEELKEKFHRDGGMVTAAPKLNVLFSARLIFMEQHWHQEVFTEHLKIFGIRRGKDEKWDVVEDLMAISKSERVELRNPQEPEPLAPRHDILSWMREGFQLPLQRYKLPEPKKMSFKLSAANMNSFIAFDKNYRELDDQAYYYAALLVIKPRSILRCPFVWAE